MKIDFYYIPTVIVILTTLIGMFRLRRLVKFEFIILLILWLIIITDLYSINQSLQNKSTLIYYNFLTPIELSLILGIYYWYIPIIRIKRSLLFCIVFLLAFSIINAIFIQDVFLEFAFNTLFLGGFMVTLFSYLLWRYEVEKTILSTSNTILWFSAANFIYYVIAIPVMSTNNWLVNYSKDWAFPVHKINLVMYGLWAVIIGLGFIWKRKQVI